ncbi:MAG: hypothetical protein IJT87_10615 [Ruminiclostridium sp.]|nr:hypothetical protein [Ruminiclostridium sp.]
MLANEKKSPTAEPQSKDKNIHNNSIAENNGRKTAFEFLQAPAKMLDIVGHTKGETSNEN